jgi:hypothetical protein
MSVAASASLPLNLEDTNWTGFDFELHYGITSGNVREVLDEILGDTATHTQIHDWDKKFTVSAFQVLSRLVRGFLDSSRLGFNTLLGSSSVEEVFTIEGINYLRPAIHEAADIDNYLFFSKVRDYRVLFSQETYNI